MALSAVIRAFITLIENALQPWHVTVSPLFANSVDHMERRYPALRSRIEKFVATKIDNPFVNRYGKHDRPFSGSGPLAGFWHCHLSDDALLIYNLKGRSLCLIVVVPHADIEGRMGPRLGQRLAAYV